MSAKLPLWFHLFIRHLSPPSSNPSLTSAATCRLPLVGVLNHVAKLRTSNNVGSLGRSERDMARKAEDARAARPNQLCDVPKKETAVELD